MNTSTGGLIGGKFGIGIAGISYDLKYDLVDIRTLAHKAVDIRVSVSFLGMRARIAVRDESWSLDVGLGGTIGVGTGVSIFAGLTYDSVTKGGLKASASSIFASNLAGPLGVGIFGAVEHRPSADSLPASHLNGRALSGFDEDGIPEYSPNYTQQENDQNVPWGLDTPTERQEHQPGGGKPTPSIAQPNLSPNRFGGRPVARDPAPSPGSMEPNRSPGMLGGRTNAADNNQSRSTRSDSIGSFGGGSTSIGLGSRAAAEAYGREAAAGTCPRASREPLASYPGESPVFFHVMTGSNLAATDRLMKAAGAQCVGGSYVV